MKLALAGALALAMMISPALADTTTAVSVPWGDLLDAFIIQIILPILGVVIAGAVAWAAKFLPASLCAYATAQNTAAVEQLLSRSITFGLNKVEGAAAGQTLTVPVGSSPHLCVVAARPSTTPKFPLANDGRQAVLFLNVKVRPRRAARERHFAASQTASHVDLCRTLVAEGVYAVGKDARATDSLAPAGGGASCLGAPGKRR